jgi:hypothetical protein
MNKPTKSGSKHQSAPDTNPPHHKHSPDDSPTQAVESGEPTITGESAEKNRPEPQRKNKASAKS